METGRQRHLLVLIVTGIVVVGSKTKQAAADCCKPQLFNVPGPNGEVFLRYLHAKALCHLMREENPQMVYARGICLNGALAESHYCGRGSCNIFGCSCEGGCLDSSDATYNDTIIDCPLVLNNIDLFLAGYKEAVKLNWLGMFANTYDRIPYNTTEFSHRIFVDLDRFVDKLSTEPTKLGNLDKQYEDEE